MDYEITNEGTRHVKATVAKQQDDAYFKLSDVVFSLADTVQFVWDNL